MSRNKRLLLLIGLQLVLLLTLVGKHQYIAATGQTITLKTAPVDPRDLFYGDYVTLRYDINRIQLTDLPHDIGPSDQGKTVYVHLQRNVNPWYEPIGVSKEKPANGPNQAVLKGKIEYFDESGQTVELVYGLERYYVPENAGRDIEQHREELTTVEIKVTGGGDALIERLVY